MHRSEIQTVTPRAIYDLSALFAAVQREKAQLDQQLEGREDWAKEWPPKSTADAFARVADQLKAWQDQGYTSVEAAAPFSDGQLTGPVENQIAEQFRRNQVKPLAPQV